jgi:predicted Zn-dependent protease with MMP-like domain
MKKSEDWDDLLKVSVEILNYFSMKSPNNIEKQFYEKLQKLIIKLKNQNHENN